MWYRVVWYPVVGGDWRQILGNERNGQASADEQLPNRLPESGPKIQWSAEIGSGYAGPTVLGQQVILFHRRNDDELVTCFDKQSGKVLWETKLPADYTGGIDADIGPRCVPIIDGDDVIVYGAAGQLSRLSLADGKVVWTIPLRKQFRAEDGYFGAGSTPLVLPDRVIVNVGSRRAGIVAVNRANGEVLWEKTAHDASYSSPILISYQEQPLAVVVTRLQLVGIRPSDGTVEFEIPFGMRGPTVNAATPLLLPTNQLFLTASYGIGTLVLDMNTSPPKTILRDADLVASQYVTPLFMQGKIFAGNGREDMGNGEICCVDVEAKKILWSSNELGVSHLIGVKDRILAINTRGVVHVLQANPQKYEKLASFELPPATYRALPALAGGCLVVRNNDGAGGGKLIVVSLSGEAQ